MQDVHRNAQIRGNYIATDCAGRRHTWSEFKDRLFRFAGGLRSLGVQDKDGVAILALNSDRYFEYYFGVPWASACTVPLNVRWSVHENAYSIKNAGAKVLVVDDAFAPMIPALKEKDVPIDHVIYIGDKDTPGGMVNYEYLIVNNDPIDDAYRSNDDLADIFYIGGTKGFLKGVMLTHTNL